MPVTGTEGAVAVVTRKVSEFDTPPPGLPLLTVTVALPAVATFAAGTAACNVVSLTNVVVSATPFQSTVEEGTKPWPRTLIVKATLLGGALEGKIVVAAGTGL